MFIATSSLAMVNVLCDRNTWNASDIIDHIAFKQNPT